MQCPPPCCHPSLLHRSLLPHLPNCCGCYLPQSLRDALSNPRLVLIGVRFAFDTVKLSEDYGLEVEMEVDMVKLAVKEMNQRELKRAGLRR
ncbi:hypothetical protein NL676_001016 [Syzygium grande]|nr:hypothetical protein NL676_001016 [Syzygium grande]